MKQFCNKLGSRHKQIACDVKKRPIVYHTTGSMLTTLSWHLKAVILGFDTVTYRIERRIPFCSGELQKQRDDQHGQHGSLGGRLAPRIRILPGHRGDWKHLVCGTRVLQLQFCLCYASYCVWQEASGNRLLFACNDLVKYVSAVATYAFPVILSHALVNGMHLSPYIIPISFAGETAGACSRVTTLALDAFKQIFLDGVKVTVKSSTSQ